VIDPQTRRQFDMLDNLCNLSFEMRKDFASHGREE